MVGQFPVYSYGWVSPCAWGAAYLFWSRWQDRPPVGSRTGTGLVCRRRGDFAGLLFSSQGHSGSESRLGENKLDDGFALDGSLGAVGPGAVRCGVSQVWHFVFPVLFCFTALPWPVWMEDSLAQNLMRFNAEVSAECLTLLGVPAIAKGNLIQVADRWVNVEEACSGIRSLQTAFMMSLFLGEFYRMKWWSRLLLLLSSVGVAFLVNLILTVIQTNYAKTDSIAKWHDTVGTISMVVCAWRRSGVWRSGLIRPENHRGRWRPVLRRGKWRGHSIFAPFFLDGCGTRLRLAVCRGNSNLGLVPGSRAHAAPTHGVESGKWPRQAPEFSEGTFADRMQALLKFNSGTTASWNTPDGYRWQMYYLQWQPGRVSKFLSSSHYPTVCLPASGMRLVSETGVWNCRIDGMDIPFTTYLFDEGGKDVYVFHAIVEDRPSVGGTRLTLPAGFLS